MTNGCLSLPARSIRASAIHERNRDPATLTEHLEMRPQTGSLFEITFSKSIIHNIYKYVTALCDFPLGDSPPTRPSVISQVVADYRSKNVTDLGDIVGLLINREHVAVFVGERTYGSCSYGGGIARATHDRPSLRRIDDKRKLATYRIALVVRTKLLIRAKFKDALASR